MPVRSGHLDFLPGIQLWNLSRDDLLRHLTELMKTPKGAFIITLNPLMVMETWKNPDFKRAVEEADIIVTDGRGIRWAARKLRNINPPIIPGVELAEDLIRLASERAFPVAFIGAQPGVWEQAKANLERKYPGLNVVGGHHGYFKTDEEAELIDRLASLTPLIVIAGMGFPKQEVFLSRYRSRFPGAILIGVGGSLDVYAGTKKRAPVFLRKLGIEWLWRMICEPRRMKQMFLLVRFWFMVHFRRKSLLK